jgi:TPR repeat protein
MLALLLLPLAVIAGPEEDYQEGFAAYRERSDIVGAIPPLTRAADGGHIEAQLLLGYILDWSEENEASVRYYQMAADAGDPRGQMELARMYLSGEGVDKDPATARTLIEEARDQGYVPATIQIAYAHVSGTMGYPKDYAQARALFQQALDQGHAQAKSGLAAVDRAEAAERAAAEKAKAAEDGGGKEAK